MKGTVKWSNDSKGFGFVTPAKTGRSNGSELNSHQLRVLPDTFSRRCTGKAALHSPSQTKAIYQPDPWTGYFSSGIAG